MAESDYVGLNQNDTPKVAENGDGTGTFWENSFKKLVNRTKFLLDSGPLLTGTNRYKFSATRSFSRVVQNMPFNNSSGVKMLRAASNIAADGQYVQEVDLPDGCSWTGFIITIDPPNDGILPGTKRVAVLAYRETLSSGLVEAVMNELIDPNGTVGAYEARHDITAVFANEGGAAETIDKTIRKYWVEIRGETGANNTAVTYHGTKVTYTHDRQDDGAA